MQLFLLSSVFLGIYIMGSVGEGILGLSFKTVKVAGKVQCQLMCLKTADCHSVYYNKDHLICELNSAHNSSNFSMPLSEDYEYTTRDKMSQWVRDLAGSCHIKSCPSQHTCVQLTSGTAVCVISSCPKKSPSVYYGYSAPLSSDTARNGTYSSEIIVGQNRTYTCATGTFLVGHNAITCKADGNWETPSFSCQECLQSTDHKGILYHGTRNITETGKTCQRWDVQTPHTHSYTGLTLVENYCRNPVNGQIGQKPWCYTTTYVRWENCGIPMC